MRGSDHESTGVLLIAHGSRRPQANDDLSRLAEAVRDTGRFGFVEIAYLEIAEPAIAEGARRLIDRGARSVRLLPFFLSAGAHVVEDLEAHRGELSREFPEVHFTLCPPLGLHPKLVEVVLERLEQHLADALEQ
jgi:sirohydrochlorin ferrochelatase